MVREKEDGDKRELKKVTEKEREGERGNETGDVCEHRCGCATVQRTKEEIKLFPQLLSSSFLCVRVFCGLRYGLYYCDKMLAKSNLGRKGSM